MQQVKLTDAALATVPLNRATRIKQLSELPNDKKALFIPPVGYTFQMGPYIFKVSVANVGQMRFTAVLHDVVIGGMNG